jgi:two-component system sensor histidine kinase AgrC
MSPLTDELKRKLAKYILSGAFFILILFLVNTFMYEILLDTNLRNVLFGVSSVGLFIFLFFAIFAFIENLRRETEIIQKVELLTNLQAYTESVENMATELRGFRHDHKNLLHGFYGYIKENDMEKLRGYYDQYMKTFTQETAAADSYLEKLMFIHIPELKSILSLKFLFAHHIGITTLIDVPDAIEGLGVRNLIDLCRIAGILLDNAMEALEGERIKYIKFTAFNKGGKTVFIFANPCGENIPLYKINEKGYTTKEGKRGLGLYNVNVVLNMNKNIIMNTFVEKGEFVQKVDVIPE